MDSEENAWCNNKDSKYCGSLSRMINSSVSNNFSSILNDVE
jgi:hypothetical protein